MASLNKVILIGNLGRDPELRYTQSQLPFAKFSLATTENYTTQAGEKRDKTEWHNIVVWGKQAEIAQKYLHKGKQIYLEGSIETREYDDKEGQRKYFTEIKAHRFLMLGRASDSAGYQGGQGQQAGGGGQGQYGGGAPAGGPAPDPQSYGTAAPAANNFGGPMQGNVPDNDDFNDDDIPF